jgi:flagellar motility protein MotE (MotC chaperone)
VSKKLIIITASAGLVSFAGAFVLGWLTKPAPSGHPDEPGQPAVASVDSVQEMPRPVVDMTNAIGTVSGSERKSMTEKQLKNLVFEVREKVQEYNDRLQNLTLREERLQRTQDTLKQDIQKLKDLRVELATIVADIKSDRDKLLKSRLEIDQTEKENLILIAASYDKMDASSASKIVVSLCTSQTQPGVIDNQSSGFDEAVKILYYMAERTKAKLLAELTTSEPKLAAFLTQKLKRIVEGK